MSHGMWETRHSTGIWNHHNKGRSRKQHRVLPGSIEKSRKTFGDIFARRDRRNHPSYRSYRLTLKLVQSPWLHLLNVRYKRKITNMEIKQKENLFAICVDNEVTIIWKRKESREERKKLQNDHCYLLGTILDQMYKFRMCVCDSEDMKKLWLQCFLIFSYKLVCLLNSIWEIWRVQFP